VKRQTADLVRALGAVNKHMPRVSTELLTGTMPADKQREFAGLLVGLANLLATHADEQEPKQPVALADRTRVAGQELLRAATQLDVGALSGPDLKEVSGRLKALIEVLDSSGDNLPTAPAAALPPDPPESPGP
jgi:hypothetical protein